jgi:hypothetical protein
MRALMVALAIVAVPGAASAGLGTTVSGEDVRQTLTPTVPAGARKQAEDAIKLDLGEQTGVAFRAEKAVEVASLRHGPFTPVIEGPISVVCGQYTAPEQNGGYAWFFVAIKRGRVLWTASDAPPSPTTEAHDSCQAVGVAN